MGIERRRAPRIIASLEIQLVGIERRSSMRRGDLSVTGIRFESPPDEVGSAGDVCTLRIVSRDRAVAVEVDARIIRVVRTNDLEEGMRVDEVALEFMPRDEATREAIAMLFVHVARAQIKHDARGLRPARPVHAVVVETDWQIRKGEALTIDLPLEEGGTARFEGHAVRSRPSRKGTYRTHFELERKESSFVGPLPSHHHMEGDVAQIRASSLLALAAMERMTGILRVHQDHRTIHVFIRDGQIVDAEEPGSEASRRKLIGEACQWERGSFELSLEPVERPDGIGVPTTVLLLQLARFYDEAARVA